MTNTLLKLYIFFICIFKTICTKILNTKLLKTIKKNIKKFKNINIAPISLKKKIIRTLDIIISICIIMLGLFFIVFFTLKTLIYITQAMFWVYNIFEMCIWELVAGNKVPYTEGVNHRPWPIKSNTVQHLTQDMKEITFNEWQKNMINLKVVMNNYAYNEMRGYGSFGGIYEWYIGKVYYLYPIINGWNDYAFHSERFGLNFENIKEIYTLIMKGISPINEGDMKIYLHIDKGNFFKWIYLLIIFCFNAYIRRLFAYFLFCTTRYNANTSHNHQYGFFMAESVKEKLTLNPEIWGPKVTDKPTKLHIFFNYIDKLLDIKNSKFGTIFVKKKVKYVHYWRINHTFLLIFAVITQLVTWTMIARIVYILNESNSGTCDEYNGFIFLILFIAFVWLLYGGWFGRQVAAFRRRILEFYKGYTYANKRQRVETWLQRWAITGLDKPKITLSVAAQTKIAIKQAVGVIEHEDDEDFDNMYFGDYGYYHNPEMSFGGIGQEMFDEDYENPATWTRYDQEIGVYDSHELPPVPSKWKQFWYGYTFKDTDKYYFQQRDSVYEVEEFEFDEDIGQLEQMIVTPFIGDEIDFQKDKERMYIKITPTYIKAIIYIYKILYGEENLYILNNWVKDPFYEKNIQVLGSTTNYFDEPYLLDRDIPVNWRKNVWSELEMDNPAQVSHWPYKLSGPAFAAFPDWNEYFNKDPEYLKKEKNLKKENDLKNKIEKDPVNINKLQFGKIPSWEKSEWQKKYSEELFWENEDYSMDGRDKEGYPYAIGYQHTSQSEYTKLIKNKKINIKSIQIRNKNNKIIILQKQSKLK